ncbi:hypothetical protein [Shewanella surugensis]|uniref:Uncharacterized protein n=1 Tax=Shewanella surugensis TaxID=212020 RepID=A0ABT0LJ77_9GAMM|nr:hypothetical protein [Shewanella surugensis]MCL1127733.1 hypothetical protein [Shewanella surugensis]
MNAVEDVLARTVTLEVKSCSDKSRVILSLLTSPSTMADRPVAVAAPKVLRK